MNQQDAEMIYQMLDNIKSIIKENINGSNNSINVSSNNSNSIKQSTSGIRQLLVETAKKYIGGKYLFGGKDMKKIMTVGVDCSGFTQGVYKECGIEFAKNPLNSASQSLLGEETHNPKPGDLIFYSNDKGNISHVAMYIGNNQIINCGSTPIREIPYDYRKITCMRNIIGD